MSLLWKNAIAVHTADPQTIARIQNGPREVPVTHAGFKSHVWGTPYSGFWEHTHDPAHSLGQDTQERLWDDTWKEPRPQSQNEYGDPSTEHEESHRRRFEDRAGQELQSRQDDRNDDLHRFLTSHATNKSFWDQVPVHHVDLSQDIHATQPYVLKDHLLRYLHNPEDTTDHAQRNLGAPIHHDRDPGSGETHPYYRTEEAHPDSWRQQHVDDYYGNQMPGFVKHEGKVHAVEGHHRVAAALLRGDKAIQGRYHDADQHGFPEPPDEDD
jgi:hypothetical protein